MKLIIAIVNKEDSEIAREELLRAGFFITKLATTGGFLSSGNTTFMMGVEEDKVDEVKALLSKFCRKRKQVVMSPFSMADPVVSPMPMEIEVGGATLFTLDIDRFEKL